GYKEREIRRESDKLLRNQIYQKLSSAEAQAKDTYRSLVNQGLNDTWDDTDHLMARLDRVVERINHSEYGYAGFFDVTKVKEPDLDRMIDYDLQLLHMTDSVTTAIQGLKEAVDNGHVQDAKGKISDAMKAVDAFPPGRHTITTLNLPLITSAYRIFFGGKTPFTATVIYVSTKQFAGKWGAKAQTTELAPLMVHGTAWFRVTDSNLFVNEVVRGQGAYNTQQVDDFIRGFINERVIDEMSKYDLQTAFTQLDKASVTVKVNINDALKRIGTDLVDFKFEGIDTSDQFRDRLFWIKQKAATSDVLRMETAKDIGSSIGSSPGAGLGAGMVLIPQVMNAQMQPSVQPQAALVACPKCGNGVQ